MVVGNIFKLAGKKTDSSLKHSACPLSLNLFHSPQIPLYLTGQKSNWCKSKGDDGDDNDNDDDKVEVGEEEEEKKEKEGGS